MGVLRISKVPALSQLHFLIIRHIFVLLLQNELIQEVFFLFLVILHPPHLELGGAVTVETLELLLPPKVCLSAP